MKILFITILLLISKNIFADEFSNQNIRIKNKTERVYATNANIQNIIRSKDQIFIARCGALGVGFNMNAMNKQGVEREQQLLMAWMLIHAHQFKKSQLPNSINMDEEFKRWTQNFNQFPPVYVEKCGQLMKEISEAL
jgi:hypothetical protein